MAKLCVKKTLMLKKSFIVNFFLVSCELISCELRTEELRMEELPVRFGGRVANESFWVSNYELEIKESCERWSCVWWDCLSAAAEDLRMNLCVLQFSILLIIFS